jgi:hypothetical protein
METTLNNTPGLIYPNERICKMEYAITFEHDGIIETQWIIGDNEEAVKNTILDTFNNANIICIEEDYWDNGMS